MTKRGVDPFEQIAPFYDWEHADYQADLPLYRALARRCDGPVLEVACGTGRLLVPLVAEGFPVTGLDVSPAMLAIAREKLQRLDQRQRAEIIEADMADFHLSRHFALAILALDSLGLLLDRHDQLAALKCIREHLAVDGLLAVDVANGNLRGQEASQDFQLQRLAPYGPSGSLLTKLVARETDLGEQVDHYTYLYDELLPSGEVRRTIARLSVRYFCRFEFEHLLERAGFRVEALYGSYDLDPFTSSSERLIAVARLT